MIVKTFVQGPIDANNYLLIDEDTKEAVLIDCSDASRSFVHEIKKTGAKLKYILLTHGHFDHILGVDKFKEIFNVDTYISTQDLPQVRASGDMIKMFTGMDVQSVTTVNHFLKDGSEFTFGNIVIKAIATPGHTKGSVTYFADGKLFTGDTLFQRSVGRCDLPGGNLEEIISSVKDILFTFPDDTPVYPGHGAQTTIGFEKKYNEIINM